MSDPAIIPGEGTIEGMRKREFPMPPPGHGLHRLVFDGDRGTFHPPLPVTHFRTIKVWCVHTQRWVKPKVFATVDAFYAIKRSEDT